MTIYPASYQPPAGSIACAYYNETHCTFAPDAPECRGIQVCSQPPSLSEHAILGINQDSSTSSPHDDEHHQNIHHNPILSGSSSKLQSESSGHILDHTMSRALCYVLWQNGSEPGSTSSQSQVGNQVIRPTGSNSQVTIKFKGCWFGSRTNCEHEKFCRANRPDSKKSLLFCCCEGTSCNDDFAYVPRDKSTRDTPNYGHHSGESQR
jgi:hypothetical protein